MTIGRRPEGSKVRGCHDGLIGRQRWQEQRLKSHNPLGLNMGLDDPIRFDSFLFFFKKFFWSNDHIALGLKLISLVKERINLKFSMVLITNSQFFFCYSICLQVFSLFFFIILTRKILVINKSKLRLKKRIRLYLRVLDFALGLRATCW